MAPCRVVVSEFTGHELSRNEFLPCGIPQVKGCTTACVLFRFGSRWSHRPQMKGHMCVYQALLSLERDAPQNDCIAFLLPNRVWLVNEQTVTRAIQVECEWEAELRKLSSIVVNLSSSFRLAGCWFFRHLSVSSAFFFTLPRSVKWRQREQS